MAPVEHVLQLSPSEQEMYTQQKDRVFAAIDTGKRTDSALTEGSPGPITIEAKRLMGVKDIKLYTPLAKRPEFNAHSVLADGIMSTSEVTGVSLVEQEDDANIIFMEGSNTEPLPGITALIGAKNRGVNGIAIRESRELNLAPMDTEDLWKTLALSATKYAIQPIKVSGEHVGFDLGSMEGAMRHVNVRSDFVNFTEYLAYMAASEYVTNHEVVEGIDLANGEIPLGMMEVMQTCADLRKNKLMPPLNLEDLVDGDRAKFIIRYLGQAGLSTGNASFWDSEENIMMITASGVDKGNLARHEVLRILRFKDEFDGVVVQPYKIDGKIKTSKTSVESFGNLATFWGSIGVRSGDIKDGSLSQILDFIQDQEFVQARIKEGYKPQYIRQEHFHAHPIAWNPELVTVLEPNANLVHNGDSHASCGTRPEAYYTLEMAIRGMVYNGDQPKVIIAKMQKHGSEVVSPFGFEKTQHILNPFRETPDVLFAPIDMGM